MSDALDQAIESSLHWYRETTKGALGGRWPMPHVTSVDSSTLIDPHQADRFLELWEQIQDKGMDIDDVADAIRYPSPLSRMFYMTRSLQIHEYPQEKTMQILRIVARLMNAQYSADPFCRDATNILWSQDRVHEELASVTFSDCRETDLCDKMTTINGLIWLYTELVYMYYHNYGHEFHGPYEYEGRQLLVRDWHDLRPEYFDFTDELPTSSFRSYELYPHDIDIGLDISNRLMADSLQEHLIGFSLHVDGNKLSGDEVPRFAQEIQSVMDMATNKLQTADHDTLLPKVAAMQFHVLKPFAELVDASYEPTEQCMQDIEAGLSEEHQATVDTVKEAPFTPEFIRAMFDPREYSLYETLDRLSD